MNLKRIKTSLLFAITFELHKPKNKLKLFKYNQKIKLNELNLAFFARKLKKTLEGYNFAMKTFIKRSIKKRHLLIISKQDFIIDTLLKKEKHFKRLQKAKAALRVFKYQILTKVLKRRNKIIKINNKLIISKLKKQKNFFKRGYSLKKKQQSTKKINNP